jgi:large subunit ribosomal protein L24
MARIRKDDLVEVVAGNDRGKRGKVLMFVPKKDRVLIQGVNLRWKHMRKSQQSPQGGRVRKEQPIHISNVMLVDEAADTRTRVGSRFVDGKKLRVAVGSGNEIKSGTSIQPKKAEKASSSKGEE